MFRILIVMMALTLQACSEQSVEVAEKPPLVVQLTEVNATNINEVYEFPAIVSAVKDVDVKFEVSGRLIEENLIEGSLVKKGEVLARIDPAPFRRKVEESRTRHQDAARALRRIEEVHAKNVASQRELDDAQSLFTLTKIALEDAEQDLSYCTIRSPFDAVIGTRSIENNSYIRAGDTVANIQDRSELYFSFEVPERVMTSNAGNREIKATASVIGHEQQVFDIHYVEHETTPDPIAQTYKITFAIDGEASELFYPGSRATVKVSDVHESQAALVVPLNALTGSKDSGFFVWQFDKNTNTVAKASVEIAAISGEFALIGKGLKAGDKVVSAAVQQMREGLKVKEYQADF
ncbi:efflux RND transporter periplasmic adaptor subunit [Thalassotalea euphylliae]|uniref:Efflux RND transporter periplasmic adaptor subunit n=1 Tax=Thalassotalea euphylliae TaxID=1655234 RepID=A0A3E0TZ10_9GAMM|nr:efflux RND transporter periplasmic adaptor subunit [Thalassotalea euphylliae]REL29637.1 efflux RND transporter periplasmic adaptor subunit [Thalassotalea euphylliae]